MAFQNKNFASPDEKQGILTFQNIPLNNEGHKIEKR